MSDWYLGPAGGLVRIPAPEVNLEVTPSLVGAVHRSVGGATTIAILAQPRTWPLKWPALTEDQASYLRMIGLNLVNGPIWLIDGETRNRIGMRISAGGSYTRTPDSFTQAGGNVPAWTAVTDPPAGVPLRGTVSWQRTTTGAGSLTIANSLDRVPVVSGEQVRVSFYARSTPGIQARAAADAFTAGGTPSRTTGTLTTLGTTTWTQLSLTYTPASDRVTHAPVLDVPSGQAASVIQATGWMLCAANQPTAWAAGGGAAIVAAGSGLTETYLIGSEVIGGALIPGTRQFGLTLLESRIA